MKTRISAVCGLLLWGLYAAVPARAVPPIEELADPTLPDIAAVEYTPGKGPVIVYNPILCRQAGRQLCEFYRYHEYGHIALRHYDRNDISRKEKEEEADRWAAKHAPRQIVMAAWRFFSAGGGATPMHGDGPTRAARLIEAREQVAMAPVTEQPRPTREPVPAFSALAL